MSSLARHMTELALAVGIAAAGCSAGEIATDDANLSSDALSTPPRSWRAHPAIVEIDDATEVYALSDVHGHYDAFLRILVANHLAEGEGDPKKAKWTGGSAILVIAGDLIDKGPSSLETIDLARALEAGAKRAGGRVVVTMGNHEAEFLADPKNKKATSTGQDATGIDGELDAQGIEPKSLVKGTDAAGRGAWLASLPFGVRIKKWFFAHGGNPQRLSVADLEAKLERSIDHHGYDDQDITGEDSILEGQSWYGKDDDNAGSKEADALGVKHIVFGHDPGALDDHGKIRASKNGVLFKLDTDMGMHDASGIGRAFLLHIDTRGEDTAESLDEGGRAKPLL
jgi:hypothetical protein